MNVSRYFVAPAIIAMSSLAAAGGFDGPSVQAGVSISAAQTSLKDYSPDGTVGDTQAVGSLSLNYSKSYAGGFNLAGGVFSTFGEQNSGSLRSFAGDTGGVWTDSFKLKNVWGVSIEPGFNLSESTLVYAKISFVQAKGENVYNYPLDFDAGSATANHRGTGFGGGVKFKLSEKVYGMVEVEQVNFNTKSYYSDVTETYQPRLVKGTIGMGYRF